MFIPGVDYDKKIPVFCVRYGDLAPYFNPLEQVHPGSWYTTNGEVDQNGIEYWFIQERPEINVYSKSLFATQSELENIEEETLILHKK